MLSSAMLRPFSVLANAACKQPSRVKRDYPLNGAGMVQPSDAAVAAADKGKSYRGKETHYISFSHRR